MKSKTDPAWNPQTQGETNAKLFDRVQRIPREKFINNDEPHKEIKHCRDSGFNNRTGIQKFDIMGQSEKYQIISSLKQREKRNKNKNEIKHTPWKMDTHLWKKKKLYKYCLNICH